MAPAEQRARMLEEWWREKVNYLAKIQRKRAANPRHSPYDPYKDDTTPKPPPPLTGRWHMVDWGFADPAKGPFMSQVVSDYGSQRAPFDADLITITEVLDHEWRLWRQVENPDKD